MSPEPPWIRLGPAEFWRAAWAASVEQNARWRNAQADEEFWDGYAESYDKKSPLADCATELIADLRALLPERGRLLEIGAGTGAFTRRLAHGLSAVTCVEPSRAMRRAFRAAWDHPIDATMIDLDWLYAPDDLSADLVLCANALYRTGDITSALSKMADAATGHVAVVQSVGRPYAGPLSLVEDQTIWERERADAIEDTLDWMGVRYHRKDYRVTRPDGVSKAALLTWAGSAIAP